MLRNSNRSSQRWTHKYTHIPYATILASSLVINGTKWRQGWSVGGLAEVCLCVYICACLLATSTLHSQSAVSRQNIIKLQMQQVHCKTCCWNEVEKTLFIVMINFKLKQIESFSFKIKMSISAYFLWTSQSLSSIFKMSQKNSYWINYWMSFGNWAVKSIITWICYKFPTISGSVKVSCCITSSAHQSNTVLYCKVTPVQQAHLFVLH